MIKKQKNFFNLKYYIYLCIVIKNIKKQKV